MNRFSARRASQPHPTRRSKKPQHRRLGFEHLEVRRVLASLYEFDVVALTGANNITDIQTASSINDSGNIAFVASTSGGQSVYAVKGDNAPAIISFAAPSSSRTYGQELQINNSDKVAVVDRSSAPGLIFTFARTWDVNNPGISTVFARGVNPDQFPSGPFASYFDILSTITSVSNDGRIGVAGLESADKPGEDPNNSDWEIHVSESAIDSRDAISNNPPGGGTELITIASGTFFRHQAADGDHAVLSSRKGAEKKIQLLQGGGSASSESIAAVGTDWSDLGIRASVSDSAKHISFFGTLTEAGAAGLTTGPGAGIFVSVSTGSGRSLQRLAGISGNGVLDPGETFEDDNSNGQLDPGEDKGGFNGFANDSRVSVGDALISSPAGSNQLYVVFTATSASGVLGVYSSEIRIPDGADPIVVGPPRPVVQVGDEVDGFGTVSNLYVHDSVNNVGQVAFVAATSGGAEAVIRASRKLTDNIEVLSWKHQDTSNFDSVEVTYELAGDLEDPFDLGFFASADDEFSSDDADTGAKITVSESVITGSPGLTLLDENGNTESDDNALLQGVHTLRIDLGQLVSDSNPELRAAAQTLAQAIAGEGNTILLAVGDPENALDETDEDDNAAAFRGFFQLNSGSRGVVRSQFGAEATINVEDDFKTTLDDGANEAESATFEAATEILVVTSDLDDKIFADSELAADLIVRSMAGDDFIVGGAGDDDLDAGDGADAVLGEGFGTTLSIPNLEDFLTKLLDKQFDLVTAGVEMQGAGSDTIQGGDGFDVIIGGPGGDTIDAGAGGSIVLGDGVKATATLSFDLTALLDADADSIKDSFIDGFKLSLDAGLSGQGDDSITGGDGVDLLIGGGGDDTLSGGGGVVDVMFGNGGEDTIHGQGDAFIVAFGGADDDTINGAGGGGFLVGGEHGDIINGGDGVDVILGDAFDIDVDNLPNVLKVLETKKGSFDVAITVSGNGDDELDGGGGLDLLIGGLGDDTVKGGSAGSILFGDGFSIDAGIAFDFTHFVSGNESTTKQKLGELLKLSENSSFTLVGDGADTITGSTGPDLVIAGEGADTITGGGGPIDLVFANQGDDDVDGSDSSTIIVFGGEGDDTIKSGSAGGILLGEDGGDTLTGGDGVDVLIGDHATFALNGEDGFAKFLADLEEKKISFETEITIEGDGEDTLVGNDGFDFLFGGGGDDILRGGDGGGVLIGDSFTLKVGPDELGFDDVFDGDDDSGNPNQDDDAAKDKKKEKGKSLWRKVLTLIGAPQFTLSGSGNDTIEGGSGLDLVFAGAGNDVVTTGGGFLDVAIGSDGNDQLTSNAYLSILIGGDGSDALTGSQLGNSLGGIFLGDDFEFLGVPINPASLFTFEFDGLLPTTIGLQSGVVQSGTGNDTVSGSSGGFNLLVGGNGNDSLTGSGFANVMFGDSLNLGANVSVSIDYTGIDPLGKSLAENLEAIETRFELPGLAGAGTDTITGAGQFNIAIGGSGDDTIDGGSGALDILAGNNGADTIRGGAGFNFIIGGDGDDAIDGGDDGNLILGDAYRLNTPGAIAITEFETGNLSAKVALVAEGSGNDTITTGDGFDVIVAGSGDDRISAGDGTNIAFGDAFEIGTTPFDLYDAIADNFGAILGGNTDLPTAILNTIKSFITFVGSGADTYIGGEDSDFAFGGAGNDVIEGRGSGLTSIDFLVGGEGDDIVDGQSGDDVVFGGPGDDILRGGDGDDHLESEGGVDQFFGGAGDDRIFGGDDGDELFGEDGDDQLFGEGGNDLLVGGRGTDTLSGGSGDNILIEGVQFPHANENLRSDIDGNGVVNLVDAFKIVEQIRLHGVSVPLPNPPAAPFFTPDSDGAPPGSQKLYLDPRPNGRLDIVDGFTVIDDVRNIVNGGEAEWIGHAGEGQPLEAFIDSLSRSIVDDDLLDVLAVDLLVDSGSSADVAWRRFASRWGSSYPA